MAALLLALILTLVLDQGTRSQRMIAAFADPEGPAAGTLVGLALAMAANAGLAALFGGIIAPLLVPEARLLFLAIALLFGAAGQMFAAFRRPAADSQRSGFVRIALRRASENAAFAVAGIAAFTGAPLLAAIGAFLGGMAGAIPPLALGERYGRSKVLTGLLLLSGIALLCAGIGSVAGALRLL